MKTLNALSRWGLHIISSVQVLAAIVFIWLDPTRQPADAVPHSFTRADVVRVNVNQASNRSNRRRYVAYVYDSTAQRRRMRPSFKTPMLVCELTRQRRLEEDSLSGCFDPNPVDQNQ